MNIYNFNRNMSGLKNLNEGEYTNQMFSDIENEIVNTLNINLDNQDKYINKEIKF